ncbi:MAG: NAD-binding protein, partial [Burkholderiales bacterium]
MLIGETEYRYQVEDDIKPFRDVLLGLFFITLGTRLDVSVLLDHVLAVAVLIVVLLAVKFALVTLLARLTGASQATALRTGIWLAQAGEFGFVLLTQAAGLDLLPAQTLQVVLAAMLISLLVSPVIIHNADWLLLRVSNQEWLQRSLQLQDIASRSLARERHVIICGYGRCGQSVAHVLEAEQVPFVALDLDPDRVRVASAAGETVVYGDSTRREALLAAGLHRASALVVTFDDAHASARLLDLVHQLAPRTPVLVRTADQSKIEALREAGAAEVVPEVIEGSLVLASHALALAGVPLNRMQMRLRTIRDNQYVMLRGFFHGADDPQGLLEGEAQRLQTLRLEPDAGGVGRAIDEFALGELGVRITALNRRGRRIVDPAGSTVLASGDTLVLAGTLDALADAEQRLTRRAVQA